MGWFFNKKKDQNQNSQQNYSTQQEQKAPIFQSKSYSYSKSKKCDTDPQDPSYIICKTIIKDANGITQQQERMPSNGQKSFFDNETSSANISLFPPMFFNHRNNQSGFRDSSAMRNNHYQENNQDNDFFKLFKQQFSAKQCHSDPQNSQYLICLSTYFEGNQKKQVKERVKVSDMNFSKQLDDDVQHLVNDLNQGMNSIFPFIGPLLGFGLGNFGNYPTGTSRPTNTQDSSYQTQHESYGNKYDRQHPASYNHHYFSMDEQKKSQTRDL